MKQMTKHMAARMSQRGVSGDMVEIARQFGVLDSDKSVLRRRELHDLLTTLRDAERTVLKLLDKGGIVVVEEAGALITTYNRDSFRRRQRADERSRPRRPAAYL